MEYTRKTSTGRTPESEPPGFIHRLILDTCDLGHEDFGADMDKLAEAVLAKIDPADYHAALRGALYWAMPDIMAGYEEFAGEEDAVELLHEEIARLYENGKLC